MLHFDNEFEIGDDLTCIVFLDVDMHGYMYVFWMYGDFIIPLSLAIVNLMYCIYLLIIELNVYITMQTMIILKKYSYTLDYVDHFVCIQKQKT